MPEFNPLLTIMSFNISSGLTLDRRLDLELTASVIENAEVDIAGLQEVDQNFSKRSDFTDQVKWLGKRLDMNIAFGPNVIAEEAELKEVDWPEEAYGNAILSRHPIISFENHLLEKISDGPESEQRGLLGAVVEIGRTPIAFYSTHLSLKEKQLYHNIDELHRIIGEKEIPIILTGDFNADPNHPCLLKIAEKLQSVFGMGHPHPSTYKKEGDHGKKIDYIFCSNHWRVLSAETIETEASDHKPILARVQLVNEA